MIIFLCLSRETEIYELKMNSIFNKYNNIENNNGNGNAYAKWSVYQIFSQILFRLSP